MNSSKISSRRMTAILAVGVFVLGWCSLAIAVDRNEEIERGVVKIVVHSNPPDLLNPWQRAGVQTGTGSGVVICSR